VEYLPPESSPQLPRQETRSTKISGIIEATVPQQNKSRDKKLEMADGSRERAGQGPAL